MNNNDKATLRPKGALKWMAQIFQRLIAKNKNAANRFWTK